MATLTLEDKIFNEQVLSEQLKEVEELEQYNPDSQVESIKVQELSIATGAAEDEIRADRLLLSVVH